MPRDRIAITPELRKGRDDFLYSCDKDWGFCSNILRRLWYFELRATCWLELTRTRKPGSWKIRFSGVRRVRFLDSGCPIAYTEELLWREKHIELVGRLIPGGKLVSRDLYVRLLYREN